LDQKHGIALLEDLSYTQAGAIEIVKGSYEGEEDG
jgi:hypothetical protein